LEPFLNDFSVSEYLQWLAVERGLSAATLEAYERDVSQFIAWANSQFINPLLLTEQAVESFVSQLLRKGLSRSSIARVSSSLRGYYSFLVEEKVVEDNPFRKMKSMPRSQSLPKPLPENVITRLLDSVSSETAVDRRDRALMEVLYGAGVRVSELVGMRLSDLDFDEELIIVIGKGNKQRLVPMGEKMKSALRSYLSPEGRQLLTDGAHDYVFVNQRGSVLTRQGVDLILKRRALDSAVDSRLVSAHVLRHSCATHMLEHGADIRIVQELLGHSSISTTQVYTAVAVTVLRRDYLLAHPRAHI
jgi:site-specific recombinase XerD